MRLQTVITVVAGVLTVVYIVARRRRHPLGRGLAHAGRLDPGVRSARSCSSMTGFGLGWVNAAADYSRYLPRARLRPRRVRLDDVRRRARARSSWWSSACCWPARRPELSDAIGADPIGALTTLLPTWFLVPFAIVAVLGLVGGAVLDIYSSGLALLAAGPADPALPVAAGVDGVIMILGTIYVVFFADDFLAPFQGFLITLGVPIAAWCGVLLADLALRRGDYAERRALRPARPLRRRARARRSRSSWSAP